jgi:hypothetical protein
VHYRRRMTKWVLLLLVACGPGLKPVPITRDVLVGDAPKLRRLMHDSVTNGGLAFDDPACAKDFGTPGEVTSGKLDAFAKCLAGLHLQPSERADTLPDAFVMQYEPGYEVQARVVQEQGGDLRFIGFASRSEGDLAVPTITHAALEKLRLAGATKVVLDEPGLTWFKICLDKSGAIVKLDPYETTSPAATKAFVAAIASWKFRPFVTRGAAIPVCSMVRLVHPAQTAGVETLPLPPPPSHSKQRPLVLANSQLIEGKRIAGKVSVFPDNVDKVEMYDAGLREITGTFRICIDEAGAVESVLPIRLTGLPRYDQKIMATMHDWRYAPYQIDGVPVPVCTQVIFVFRQSTRPRVITR